MARQRLGDVRVGSDGTRGLASGSPEVSGPQTDGDIIFLDRPSLVRHVARQADLDMSAPAWFDVTLIVDEATRAELARLRTEYAGLLDAGHDGRAGLRALAPAYDAVIRTQLEQIGDAIAEYPTVPPPGLARALFEWTNATSGVRDLVALERAITRAEPVLASAGARRPDPTDRPAAATA